MQFKIVVDSCCDLDSDMKRQMNVSTAPLTITLEGKEYRDDEGLNMDEFLQAMKNSSEAPKTACPSPKEFIDNYKGDEKVFVVTLSSGISGTYKSALIAKDMFMEEYGKKFIHVFDTLSASVGETMVSLKISELIKNGCEEFQIVEKVSEYIRDMKTFFMLESLDNLVKAGRISPLVAKVTSILNVRAIMAGTEEGTIKLYDKVVGAKRAFKRFVEIVGEQGIQMEDRILGIAHCNCLDKALEFKEEVLKKYKFKDVVIVKTGGISTVYANEGGLVVAF